MATRSRILTVYAIMAIVWIGLLVLLPIAARGQQPTLASPHDAVAELVNFLGNGVESPSGSGTLIEANSKPVILTCDHLFHRTRPRGDGTEMYAGRLDGRQVICTFPGGHRTNGRLVAHSESMDVALVSIEQAPPKVQPVKLVPLQPAEGPFVAIGYPAGYGGQHWRLGKFLRFRRPFEAILSTPMKSGYSGGALVNKHGEQVGVVCSTTKTTSTHAAGPDLISFVERSVPK